MRKEERKKKKSIGNKYIYFFLTIHVFLLNMADYVLTVIFFFFLTTSTFTILHHCFRDGVVQFPLLCSRRQHSPTVYNKACNLGCVLLPFIMVSDP